MTFKRSSGILLHPSSLPGPYGIGDLGPQAYRFVDWLSSTDECGDGIRYVGRHHYPERGQERDKKGIGTNLESPTTCNKQQI